MSKDKKITVNPYLTFSGNCREAIMFYKEALDGEIELMTFEGSPVDVPENYKDMILHASLTIGNAIIMASDAMPNEEIVLGNAYNISISTPDAEKGEHFFKNLSAGGSIVMPFGDAFWDAKFGMLIDKFGIHWMINCQKEQK